MKKIFFVFALILCMLCMSACGNESKSEVSEQQYADSEEYLNAMARGISNRLKKVDDTKERTDEEKQEYYTELVSCELDEVEKYYNKHFADATFDELVHRYIEACKMQRTGADNMKNSKLYSALWNGGRSVRSGIIVEFYERYNLPITSEEVSSFFSSNSNVSVTANDDILGHLFESDSDDVRLSKGDISIVSATGEVIINRIYSHVEIKITAKNNSIYDLTLAQIEYAVLAADDTIITSSYAWLNSPIPAGSKFVCESSIDLEKYPDANKIKITGATYDGDGDNVVHPVGVEESDIENNVIVIEKW